jgi:ketosteroid isomerase-like protein
VDQSWGEAFRTCALPMMDRLFHDDLIFIVQSGIIHHKKDQLASVGRCDMKQMDVHPALVRVFGDTAIVHGSMDYRLDGPRANGGTLVYSRTYLRVNREWKMVQHQSTLAPQPAN